MQSCIFCLGSGVLEGEVVFTGKYHYFVKSIDSNLPDSGMIIPMRHITTPFDYTADEWIELQVMLEKAKSQLLLNNPEGFNLGWNIGTVGGQNVEHVHFHIIGRFSDEPLAGKGIRSHLKADSSKPPSH